MQTNRHKFSGEIEAWLKGGQAKTLDNLEEVFDEKGFAIAFVLLMLPSALPLPTGGITNLILEPLTLLIALEMIIGRRTIWLPKRIKQRPVGSLLEKRALPFMAKRIKWLEKWSRPRWGSFAEKASFRTITGLLVFTFALAAVISPPFSGLDTLPSIGVVLLGLSLILEDFLLFLVGLIVGSIGLGLVIGTGAVLTKLFQTVF